MHLVDLLPEILRRGAAQNDTQYVLRSTHHFSHPLDQAPGLAGATEIGEALIGAHL